MDFTSLTPQQILEFGKPCDELQDIIKTLQRPQIDWSDSTKALGLFRSQITAFEKTDQPDAEVEEETYYATARDGTELPVKAWRPAKSTSTSDGHSRSPLILLYFAGGFIMGSPTTLGIMARPLVKLYNAVVVAPTYRLAPEHPFPTSVHDGWDMLQWVADNAEGKLRAKPAYGFIVGGISSGGNLTNVIVHMARDEGLKHPITGVWLCCAGARLAPSAKAQLPAMYTERYLSRTQDEIVNGPFASPGLDKLKAAAIKADIESHLWAPLVWPTKDGHKGFPKTFSQICGIDPPRDESLIFDDMLKREGVPTRLNLYPGLPHVFFAIHKTLPQSKQWEIDAMTGFKWLLQ